MIFFFTSNSCTLILFGPEKTHSQAHAPCWSCTIQFQRPKHYFPWLYEDFLSFARWFQDHLPTNCTLVDFRIVWIWNNFLSPRYPHSLSLTHYTKSELILLNCVRCRARASSFPFRESFRSSYSEKSATTKSLIYQPKQQRTMGMKRKKE